MTWTDRNARYEQALRSPTPEWQPSVHEEVARQLPVWREQPPMMDGLEVAITLAVVVLQPPRAGVAPHWCAVLRIVRKVESSAGDVGYEVVPRLEATPLQREAVERLAAELLAPVGVTHLIPLGQESPDALYVRQTLTAAERDLALAAAGAIE